jgi:hypothetical protein
MIRIRVKVPSFGLNSSGLSERVMTRYQKEAGDLIVEHIRAHLGRDDLYALSDRYKERKPRMQGYDHLAGRSEAQPLVFSQEMYNAICWRPQGDLIVIQVEDGKALGKDDFDYAERWEETTHFLELGVEDVEDQLATLLGSIIAQELGMTA